ncbi:MAG TPA: ATP-binding protein [Desulfuromonadales bacterium]|nr:ATP-binding protein [Desulfuromonadales bacterium]
MNDRNPMDGDELARLRRENETLSKQVKRLVRAEGQLYAYQEELDAQLKEYKNLYELNRKIHATFEIRRIFEEAIPYIIHDLEYERVIFLQRRDEDGDYVVSALDGFYDPPERDAVAALTLSQDDPALRLLSDGKEYLICASDSDDPCGCRQKLHMLESLIYPLGSSSEPFALLVVGNSATGAEFYNRISDADGALLGMGNLVGLLSSRVANCTYFTSMEKALEQERRAESKYRGIFENAAEGIYQSTWPGRFLNSNPAAANILGYASPEEMIETVTDIERQLYAEPQRRRELWRLLCQGRSVNDFEVELYRKDGERRWVKLSARPVLNSEGDVLYADGIIQDISERKRAEQALQTLNEELEQRVSDRTSKLEKANSELIQLTSELEEANRELKSAQSQILQQEKMASIGQLAAGVAHEINNPMGFIISNLNSLGKYAEKITTFLGIQSDAVQALIDETGSADIIENLQRQKQRLKMDYIVNDLDSLIRESQDGAERIKEIVQNLKSFSRVGESEFKVADINEGIEKTINIVWNELKYKAEVKKDYGDIPPIYCNLGELNQVFMNLLVNAAQAIETQGKIAIKTFRDEKDVFVAISDTGSGIPPEKLGRIFEPFFTTKEVGKGTGLGLSIAYDIVKKHGGEIGVESSAGAGTVFTIRLPARDRPA